MLNRLFGSRDVPPETREQVIAYLRALSAFNARQDDDAGKYNQVLLVHGAGMSPGNQASRIVAESAAVMAATNRDLVKAHAEWGPIPDAAGACYLAWQTTFMALAAWSDAAAAAYQALADGGNPIVGRVSTLLQHEEREKQLAIKAQGNLMKRIKMTVDEARVLWMP